MNWNEYFMSIAEAVSLKSKDPFVRVGCVIVGSAHCIRSTGFNGIPRGVDDENSERLAGEERYKWFEHAERNAIYNAARSGARTRGCGMYCTWFPCMDCARALVQAGISHLYCRHPDVNDPKWGGDFGRALILLAEAGIRIVYLP